MPNKKMNVLLYSVLPKKVQGGIATWTSIYLQECEQHGIDCDLVNCAAEGARAENPEAKLSIRDEIKRTIRIYTDLRNVLKKEHDIAHVNTSCGPMGIIRDCLAVKFIRTKGIKVVLHFHCDIPFWINRRISMLCLKSLCRNSDICLVLCRNSSLFLKKTCSADSIVVPNFVPQENIVNSHCIRHECKKLIYVGGVQPDKGCYEIFEAAKRHPDKQFALVGPIDESVNISDVSENVKFAGSVSHDRVLNLLDESDVFLFPSHSEGFSLSLAEAMSRGLPVITTDVGANVDMHENIGGFTVPINSASEIVNAINKAESETRRREMSEWNLSKVKNNYTSPKVLGLFSEIYRSVL